MTHDSQTDEILLKLRMKLNDLPFLPKQTWLKITDSHDVTGFNNDGFSSQYSYLYTTPDGMVLFDYKGKGCIRLIRSIGYTGSIYIDVDGIRKTIPFCQMYSGKDPDYPEVLVANEDKGMGSAWSFVEIPFEKSCRISASDMIESYHFYNIWVHLFGSERVENPKIEYDLKKTVNKTDSLMPYESVNLMYDQESGVLGNIKLRCVGNNRRAFLKDVRLKAWWDDQILPCVDAPIGMFFASGYDSPNDFAMADRYVLNLHESKCEIPLGRIAPSAIPVGEDGDGVFYCCFPMPYWKKGHMILVNESGELFENIQIEIDLYGNPYPPEQSGYFHAIYHREVNMPAHRDYRIMQTRGTGRYVGCVMRMTSQNLDCLDKGIRQYLEGDARFYIDDSRAFLCGSTGTEEYFNWGWYDTPGKDHVFSFPFHGYTEHLRDIEDHSTMYRFHLTDDVPYYRSLIFELEHGPSGETSADYSSVAFYYQNDRCALALSDIIDISDTLSEEQHDYVLDGSFKLCRKSQVYEGNAQVLTTRKSEHGDLLLDADTVDSGKTWKGIIKFTVRLASNNQGARIRRRYDGQWDNKMKDDGQEPDIMSEQSAMVYVDNQCVGEWYQPPAHSRACWLEDEFEIPAAHTVGKQEISIKLVNIGESGWNDYRYSIFTYV